MRKDGIRIFRDAIVVGGTHCVMRKTLLSLASIKAALQKASTVLGVSSSSVGIERVTWINCVDGVGSGVVVGVGVSVGAVGSGVGGTE